MNRFSLTPWWAVVAGAIGCSVGAGIFIVYAFGIFATGITRDLGWSRETISFCLTSFLVASGVGSVLLGSLIRRWGVRRPSSAFILIFATSVAALAFLPPSKWLFYANFALMGIGGAAATAMPYAVNLTALFEEKRGLALGLVNAGAGFGATLAPQYASYCETHFGWRLGLMSTALIIGATPLVCMGLLVRDPVPPEDPAEHSAASLWRAILPLLKRSQFWLIAIPVIGISVVTFGVMGCLVPMMSDRGSSPSIIALALSTAGMGSWIGRPLIGYFVDKVFAPRVATVVFYLGLLGVIFVAIGPIGLPILAGAALLGLTLGAEGDLVTYLASRYFGADEYSQVLGLMWVAWAWGGSLGTSTVGVTFHATGGYQTSMLIFGLLLVICVILLRRLGPYLVISGDSHRKRLEEQAEPVS